MAEINPEIIEIADDEGNIILFEVLDRIETDNAKYVALLPVYENEDENADEEEELIILKAIEEENEIFLEPIEDDKEFDEIGAIFEERLAELYEFED